MEAPYSDIAKSKLSSLKGNNSALPRMSGNSRSNSFWKEAEQSNGRLAMIGFFALIHNYIVTGWVIPGIY